MDKFLVSCSIWIQYTGISHFNFFRILRKLDISAVFENFLNNIILPRNISVLIIIVHNIIEWENSRENFHYLDVVLWCELVIKQIQNILNDKTQIQWFSEYFINYLAKINAKCLKQSHVSSQGLQGYTQNIHSYIYI